MDEKLIYDAIRNNQRAKHGWDVDNYSFEHEPKIDFSSDGPKTNPGKIYLSLVAKDEINNPKAWKTELLHELGHFVYGDAEHYNAETYPKDKNGKYEFGKNSEISELNAEYRRYDFQEGRATHFACEVFKTIKYKLNKNDAGDVTLQDVCNGRVDALEYYLRERELPT